MGNIFNSVSDIFGWFSASFWLPKRKTFVDRYEDGDRVESTDQDVICRLTLTQVKGSKVAVRRRHVQGA